VSGIVSHAITRDFAHDKTEIIIGNIFSQTDDLYQPEPALQLVPVTPSQGNALRGGASRHVSRERAFNLPAANVRRLHRGSKLACVTARPVYRQGKALRALPAAVSSKKG